MRRRCDLDRIKDAPYAVVVPVYSNLPEDMKYMGNQVFDLLDENGNGDFSEIDVDARIFESTSGKALFPDSVRGKKLFVVHPYHVHHDRHTQTAVRIANAAKQSRAKEVVLVEPYNKAWRQDTRKDRESLDARMVADQYKEAGIDDVLAFEPHSPQIVMAFSPQCPIEPFYLTRLFAEYLKTHFDINSVCAPDAGAEKSNRKLAEYLDAQVVLFLKARDHKGVRKKTELFVNRKRTMDGIDDIKGKTCALFDDVISSAGSIKTAGDQLREAGAKDVIYVATHADLTDRKKMSQKEIEETEMDAYERLAGETVVISNSIPGRYETEPNFHVLKIEHILADIIQAHAHDESLSKFFK